MVHHGEGNVDKQKFFLFGVFGEEVPAFHHLLDGKRDGLDALFYYLKGSAS